MTGVSGGAGEPGTAGEAVAVGELAARLLGELKSAGATLAVAESLTGGLLAATLVDVPGASAAFRGSVTAYATAIKASVLGVDEGLLAVHGAVHPVVARQMADGVRRLLGADYGLATTGVAGPEPQDGQPVGTVHVATAGPGGTTALALRLSGERATIRRETVVAAVRLLLERLANESAAR